MNDFADTASDYLAGLLTAAEALAFEQRLAGATAEECRLFAGLQNAAALTILSDTPVLKAPASAKAAVMAAIRPAPPQPEDVFTYHLDDAGWEPLPMPVPGARWKVLHRFPTGAPRTFLLELPPGCEFPDHPHPGDEECLLLKGDLVNDGCRLGPGDYVRARAGTHHHGLHTIGGCVCLLILNAA